MTNLVQIPCRASRTTPALLDLPSGGDRRTMLVTHHGGPGGNPAGGPFGDLASRATEAGYAVLGLSSRMSSEYTWTHFQRYIDDLADVLDWAGTLGYTRVVLVGHSMGCMVTAAYAASTQDPRVVAVVQLAPTLDLPDWVQQGHGEARYSALVEGAVRACQEGLGHVDFVDSEFEIPPPTAPGTFTRHTMTARAWLSWYGPESRVNSASLAQLRVPVLLACGDADDYNWRERVEALQLVAAQTPAGTADLLWYEGGTGHDFVGKTAALADDVVGWLDAQLAHAPVKVESRRITLGTKIQSALRYRPATPVTPVVLLPALVEDPIGGASDELARHLAQHGVDVLHPLPAPGGFLSLTRDGTAEHARIVAAWITEFAAVAGSTPTLVAVSHAELVASQVAALIHDVSLHVVVVDPVADLEPLTANHAITPTRGRLITLSSLRKDATASDATRLIAGAPEIAGREVPVTSRCLPEQVVRVPFTTTTSELLTHADPLALLRSSV